VVVWPPFACRGPKEIALGRAQGHAQRQPPAGRCCTAIRCAAKRPLGVAGVYDAVVVPGKILGTWALKGETLRRSASGLHGVIPRPLLASYESDVEPSGEKTGWVISPDAGGQAPKRVLPVVDHPQVVLHR